MGQVSVGWVEVEATGNVCHAQGEMCEWEEDEISLELFQG